jgi:hypothetical protein
VTSSIYISYKASGSQKYSDQYFSSSELELSVSSSPTLFPFLFIGFLTLEFLLSYFIGSNYFIFGTII